MQRQAVSFVQSEKCILELGWNVKVVVNSGVPTITEHEGKIIYTDIDKIISSAMLIPIVSR